MEKEVSIAGLKFTRVEGLEKGSDQIKLYAEDGRVFAMWHDQDCCEMVTVDDVVGDALDLVDAEIVSYSEDTDSGVTNAYDSYTWTFYNFQTTKGHVQIKWYGTSNGYYSEKVTFAELTEDHDFQRWGNWHYVRAVVVSGKMSAPEEQE